MILAAGGGTAGVVEGGTQSALQGNDLSQIAIDATIGGIVGAASGGLLGRFGPAISKWLGNKYTSFTKHLKSSTSSGTVIIDDAIGATNSAAKIATELHHPLPKFLGGFLDQVRTKLSKPVHKEFHALLRNNLKNAGIPLNVGARGGSAADWARYMTANPDAQRKAFDAVLETSRAIDLKYGTKFVQDVWTNLICGNFTPYP